MISPLASKSILTSLHHDGPGSNGTVTRLVMHATVSPCTPGGAEANAHYFCSASAGGAAHYVVDPQEVVACVDEDQKAAHAPPNAGSIGIELCDPQTGDPARWSDDPHRAMLELAGPLAADICARHRLPVVWLSPDDLLAGRSGITSHDNVSRAWHQSDHTDPGDAFPVDAFLALVGAPSPQPEDDTVKFHYAQKQGDPKVWLVSLATTPRHVELFRDAEYWATTEGHTVLSEGSDKLGADGNGDTRQGVVLDDKGCALFGIPTG